MIFKILAEHLFIKEYYFQKHQRISGHLPKQLYPIGTTKSDFDNDAVLDRFEHQLKSSDINTNHTLSPDFSWSLSDISQIKNYHQLNKYIILFPFCSPHLTSKKWPYYNDLINMINEKFDTTYKE